jgi:hypothetical protein
MLGSKLAREPRAHGQGIDRFVVDAHQLRDFHIIGSGTERAAERGAVEHAVEQHDDGDRGGEVSAGSHSSARASLLSYACARASYASPAQIQRTKKLQAALQRKSSAWFQNLPCASAAPNRNLDKSFLLEEQGGAMLSVIVSA